MTPPPKALGPGEAARRLGVSTRTIQRWLRQGRLAAVPVGGRLKVDPLALPRSGGGRQRSVRTLAVANRGEIVGRIAGTCRALGIRCVALVPTDQQGAWWTEQADARVRLDGGYLDTSAVIAAARAAGADAIHPGYGFLAENADFADAVAAAGLVWIGPPPGAVRLMGDKVQARRLAAREGVPLLPGSDGRRQSDRALASEAERIGYPVLIKPVGGGGGKGMHVARTTADLRELLATARREAVAAFGDDRLLLERYLDRPRHVEIQVLLDDRGEGIHLGERECSLQRRHQKVVEESPSPGLRARRGDRLRQAMGTAAVALARAAGYAGAGTVEFLLDESRGEWFFLEMNARLQVEHPVTELVTGRDLVADQLAIAEGATLDDLPAVAASTGDAGPWAHAMEARLYAEDAEQGFLPAGGRVVDLRWPAGEGVRVDAGIGAGDEVSTRYDPLLAKIVVGGADRDAAVRRLREALDGTLVLGPVTNLRFLRWIASSAWFARGETFTDTIPTRWHPDPAALTPPDEAWLAAAGSLSETLGGPLAGWRLNEPARLRLRSGEEERSVGVPEGKRPVTAVERTEPARVHVDVDGRSVAFTLASSPTVESAVRHAAHGGPGTRAVTAPMPGRVIAVLAREGAAVEIHEPLVVLEAMKMENAVTASGSGTVAAVLVRPGAQVQKGDLLVELVE